MTNRSAANPDSKPLEGAERIRTAGLVLGTETREDDAEQYVTQAKGHEGHVVTVKTRRDGYAYWKCSCGAAHVGWRQGAM